MFMKDFTLYRAYYCGVCKSIGRRYGQLMRFSTSYDITFLAMFMHGVTGVRPHIKRQACILSPKKKCVVQDNGITRTAVDINTLLMRQKAADNVRDGSKLWRLPDTLLFRRKAKKAAKRLPQAAQIISAAYAEQAQLEAAQTDSTDRAAEPTAVMMRGIMQSVLGEFYTQAIGEFWYNLGRWVYIMDAIDDIDSDFKKKRYNPLLIGYNYKDKPLFLSERAEDLALLLNTAYANMVRCFKDIKLETAEGALTNIIWYGLKERTQAALNRSDNWRKIRI